MDLPITVTWPPTLTLDKVGKYMVVADSKQITPESSEVRVWHVLGSKGNPYTVSMHNGSWTCSCPGFGWRRKCKHIEAQKALTTS